MSVYLVVHDMNEAINEENCALLGLEKGSTYNDIKKIHAGIDRTKDGKPVWLLPHYAIEGLILNPIPEVYEMLTEQEIRDYGFDVEEI